MESDEITKNLVTKMSFSWKCFTVIAFSLASIVTQSFGELFVMRHIVTDSGKTKDELICMSEDDGSALIWNYNITDKEINGKFRDHRKFGSYQNPIAIIAAHAFYDQIITLFLLDTQAEKPMPKITDKCLVWNSTSCVAEWHEPKLWKRVNSTDKPMGPVFDRRWEDFEEFEVGTSLEKQDYRYVGTVNKSSGTTVFSALAQKNIFVFLCESKHPENSPCIWIIIRDWEGRKSAIRNCNNGAPKRNQVTYTTDCKEVINVAHNAADILDPYEWRTFGLNWNSEQRTIKVFKDYDREPFLEGIIPVWRNDLSHLSVQSDSFLSRIRFHSYEYFLSRHENAVISTKNITNDRGNLCLELLAGFCSACGLNVTLTDIKGNEIKMWTKFGDTDTVYDELLTWRSFKVNMTFSSVRLKSFRLEIRTIRKEEGDKGHWAIGNFHVCKLGKTRELPARTDKQWTAQLIPAKCQKLSYNKSAVVDPFSKTGLRNPSQYQQFLRGRERQCGSNCPSLGKRWLICDSTGCTCDRGFTKSNCSEQCSPGFYGYNCSEKCGLCNRESCDKITGYCITGCNRFADQPPLCKKKLAKLMITDIADTTAKILQRLEPQEDVGINVSFVVKEVRTKNTYSEIQVQVTNASMGEANINNLKPNTIYKVHAVLNVDTKVTGAKPISAIVAARDFTTTWKGKPCFELLRGEKSLIVTMQQRVQECGYPPNGSYSMTVFRERPNINYCADNVKDFPYTCPNLALCIECKVTINVMGRRIFASEVSTFESAPDPPQNLTANHQTHGIVRLKWRHPANIKRFRISFDIVDTNLLVPPISRSAMTVEYAVEQEHQDYSYDLHLFTSTYYKISVVAVNEHNIYGMESNKNIWVPAGLGFAEEGKLQVTRSGAVIKVKVPTIVNTTKSTMVSIIVTKGSSTCIQRQSRGLSEFINLTEWIAKTYEENESRTSWLNNSYRDMFNCSLDMGETYEIVAVFKDKFFGVTVNRTSSLIVLINDENNELLWLLLLLPIAVCLLLLFVWYRKRKKVMEPMKLQETRPLPLTMTSTGWSTAPCTLNHSTALPVATENRIPVYQSTQDMVEYNPQSHPVKIEEFEEYIKEALASGLLDSQYVLLPKTATKTDDDTRVVLNKLPGDPRSYYIDANYIRGYRKKKAYIAAQGPIFETVKDFWKMVWQEKVQVVYMLSNVTEDGKSQCTQYWPQVGAKIQYGDILVSNTEHQIFADYTIRTFKVLCKKQKRQIMHLQYTGWPDYGVPTYTQSFVAYLKKILATPVGKGPAVVHCLAGVGRAGILILCDICLRRAVAERVIDVPAITVRMREDRENMVENVQQYVFAQLVVMESMVVEQTQVSCTNDFPEKIKELREQLPDDMQRLKDNVWQDRVLHSLITPLVLRQETAPTNRLSEHIPDTPTGAYSIRNSSFDSESNYITAVSVDGVKMKKQYLGSHLPSPSTLSEYWKLIAEKKIELVIMLQRPNDNDHMCCDLMQSGAILVPIPYMQVEIKKRVVEEARFTMDKLIMTDRSERKTRRRLLTVLTCTGWGRGKCGKPPEPATLVSLWRASEQISRKEAPTLVLCHDGVTGCGLYLALSFLLERIAVERECDVISAVRAVRRSRTEFVQSLEQFEYLYDAAVNYVGSFETYANFT